MDLTNRIPIYINNPLTLPIGLLTLASSIDYRNNTPHPLSLRPVIRVFHILDRSRIYPLHLQLSNLNSHETSTQQEVAMTE